MFRHSAHSFVRSSCSNLPRRAVQLPVPRRYASIPPPRQKARSKRHVVLRLGIVAGGLYWYNTSSVFAEEPVHVHSRTPHTNKEDKELPTIDDIAAARKARMSAQFPLSSPSTSTQEEASAEQPMPPPGDLEEEAESEGAFNPETGEINWDCPCLGGMAHGPCGEEFRAAFSCFVYSKEEPKGMDCIDKFKGMQDCFRQYPEVYGDELADDSEDGDGEGVREEGQSSTPQPTPGEPSKIPASDVLPSTPAKTEEAPGQPRTPVVRAHISAQEKPESPQVTSDSRATIASEKQMLTEQEPISKSDHLRPKE